jgi:glycogen synthase
MKKLNVLMLGWEFPPVINGGLGVACLGLAKAMSSRVNLSMILPKTDPDFIVNNVELIGLNNISIEEIRKSAADSPYQTFSKVEYIETEIFPYNSGSIEESVLGGSKTFKKGSKDELKRSVQSGNIFTNDDLYGTDVHSKVVKYAEYAANLAQEKDFDVIHAHDWMTFLAGIEIKKRTGKPLVVHVHSLNYDRGGPESRGWIFDIEKHGMEMADVVIPVSNYTGSIVTGHYSIYPKKVIPVHNGADAVVPFKVEKHFPEKLVLFLGRITGQKGPEFFLEIASKVLSQNNNVRFVMAGTGDKLKRVIETGAYRQVGNKFHFTGFLNKEKVNTLLSMADVYCMPSVSEPFGLSALEAAQFGIPAVISKQSGVAEVLKGALKADFWDVNLMAQHIISLLENEETRKNVIEESYKDIQNLTWDKAADAIVKIYDEKFFKTVAA